MGKQVDKNDFWFIENNPITKVGVYPYLGKQISQDCEPDKIYYVLRPKEELFRKETLDSLRLIPLIDGHTMIGKDFTAPEDKGLDGTLGDNVSHDTDTIYNDLKIISNKMKEEIQNGKKELSLGYFCRYDKQPGTYKGQRYDYVQRDIIANHLALVDKGRMGADVRVYDSKDIPEGEAFAMDSIDITMDKEFNENDVNRDDRGRFATKGQSATKTKKEKENNSSSKKPLYSIKNENVQMSGGTEKDVINIVNDFIEGHGEGKKVDNIDDALEIGKKYNLFFVKHNTKKDWINYDAGRKFAPMIRDNKLLGEVLHYIEQLPIAEDMALDDEDIEWITVRGTHIPIKKGESKEQAVKKFLAGKRNQNNKEKEYFGSEEHKKLREQGKKAGLTEEEMNKLDDITKKISEKNEQSGSKAEPERKEQTKEEWYEDKGKQALNILKKMDEKNLNKTIREYRHTLFEQKEDYTPDQEEIRHFLFDIDNQEATLKQVKENLEKNSIRNRKDLLNLGKAEPEQAGKISQKEKRMFKNGNYYDGSPEQKELIEEDIKHDKYRLDLESNTHLKKIANLQKEIKRVEQEKYPDPDEIDSLQRQITETNKKYKRRIANYKERIAELEKAHKEWYGQDSMEYKTIQGEGKMADKKEKVAIDEDKRKIIDEIGGILKDAGLDDELIRTVIGKAEKIAYNKSEAGDDGEEVEEEEFIEEENVNKKPAKDKCGKDDDEEEADKEEEEKKKVVKAFAQKEKLGKEVEDALGTFDHSEMTELEIAKYACDKLDLEVEKGQEISAVKGYLKGLAKAPKATFGYKTVAADSGIQTTDAEFEKFVNKGE